MIKQNTVRFVLDNRIVEITFDGSVDFRPSTTVLQYLRSLDRHKGTKEGCAEGDCGACTVVVAEPGENGRLAYKTVDSCLLFLPMLHGKQLITVENLADGKQLHPVQESLVQNHGSQCGYCTPGMVMSMFGIYKNHVSPSRSEIEEGLAGNLCRCTGYRSILEATGKACKNKETDHFNREETEIASLLSGIASGPETLELTAGGQRYFKPFTLSEALRLVAGHPDAVVMAGATDVALRQTKRHEFLPLLIDISAVEEFSETLEQPGQFRIGAGITLERLRSWSHERLPMVHSMLNRFGSLQIRNMATIGGNIGSASPIGDLLPVLIACRARVAIAGPEGERESGIEEFIRGYHAVDLKPGELIAAVILPVPPPEDIFFTYKVSRRRDMDISTVSAAFRMRLSGGKIEEIILAYGGMAATPVRAKATEKFLTGRTWSEETVREAMLLLSDEFTPLSDARAEAPYRRTACANLLMKFFLEQNGNAGMVPETEPAVPTTTLNGASAEVTHESSILQTTGEALFIEDLYRPGQHLTGRVVYSPHPRAVLKSIDLTEALKVKGVRAILTAADIPGINQMGPVVHDEPCLADGEVAFIGQTVALIAAESEEAAIAAERLIRVEYQPLTPVLELEDAIATGNLLAPPRTIERGDVNGTLAAAPHRISGELRTGAQEHWYLETQTCLAIPREGGGIFLHASTQNPAETQAIAAEVLGIGKNEVEVEVRRMGGGFGGKETQSNHVAAWSTLLANATKQSVRIHLFRDDDQVMTGKRHRFLSRYEVGFNEEGRILAYRVELNSDAGFATDLSKAILERAMLHAENAYYIPNVSVTGLAWKTNHPSNTAFRGFGGPQGMAVIENAIDRIARFLGRDAADIRLANFYGTGEQAVTPYGARVVNNRLGRIFERLTETSQYRERRLAVDAFNRSHGHVKKGLALTPVKFGISFTTSFLNQAGALVNLYTDGTALVNHGGTEMGQGLHTKMRRIAALELGIPEAMVKVNATSTAKVPNTSPTAASSGSDLNGMAVKNAVDKLKERMIPVAVRELTARFPGTDVNAGSIVFRDGRVFSNDRPEQSISFAELCNQARIAQISLSATGYYKTPGIWFDRESGTGNPFHYYAFGMAVSEVLIDCLTGAHTLLRTDILQDAGDPVSDGIDIGQVEGGFIQGAGWCTIEEVKWDRDGRLLTRSPDTYKIPGVRDIPADFRVELLPDAPNPGTIRSSKAVGEPPFMLGLSVWMAIKDAVSAACGPGRDPYLPIPATGEAILTAIHACFVSSRQLS